MAITITEILETDEIAGSRTTINENFESLKTAIEEISSSIIDTETGEITASKFTIERGANTESEILSINQASESIAGNLTVGGDLTADTLTVSSGATFTTGNVTIESEDSVIDTQGSLKVKGAVIYPSASTSINASLESAWDTNTTGTVSGTNVTLTVTKRNLFILDFSSYNGTTNKILTLTLPGTATAGQYIRIVAKKGSSPGTHKILYNNIAGLTNSNYISLVAGSYDYRVCEFLWTGAEWIITNLQGATIV